MLYPNCSEAVYRIDLTNLTEAEIEAIEAVLTDLAENHEFGKEDEEGNENDEENKWYDTGFGRKDIFGKKVIVVQGEVPYNCSDWLEGKLSKLPFWHKVSTEMDYP